MNLANKLIRIGESESAGNQSLMQIITSLGLTTGLKLCLDAGDSASYDPAVQTDKWLDTSGNGCDFFLGTGTGSDAADPTFNGIAGRLSAGEYFSLDGADYFTYDSANEVWMNNLHKDNAKFTALIACSTPSLTTVPQVFFGTNGDAASTRVGVRAYVSTTSAGGPFATGVSNGSSAFVAVMITSGQMSGVGATSINFAAFDEAVSANSTIRSNAYSSAGSNAYTSPSTAAATYTMQIGASGNGARPLIANSRLYCFAMWEGVALTSTQLSDIYNQIKGRFGL